MKAVRKKIKNKKKNLLKKDSIIASLKENKGIIKKEFGVTKIALFGSYAREEATEKSDIDLLIEMKDKDFFKKFSLKEFLEDIFKKEVNIIYFGSLRTFIKRSIEEDIIYV